MDIIGVCTWTLGISDLEALMAKIQALGLNGVQYCEPMDAYPALEVKKMADRYGLQLIVYDPFACRPGTKNGSATLEHALQFYKKAIDYAAVLQCGQTIQGLSAWTEACKNDQEAWQFLITSVQTLATYAHSKGVPLSYEPCNRYEVPCIHTAAEYEQLMHDAGCPDITVLLDAFHMNIGEKDPVGVLRRFAGRTSVFHISGSNREGIAQGHLDFKAYHDALQSEGFTGPCVIECVLSGNPTNTPPRNVEEMERLTEIVEESRDMWQGYSARA